MTKENTDAPLGAHKELVELNLVSKMPSRAELAGLNHTLRKLDAIKNRVHQINSMTVAPAGLAAGGMAGPVRPGVAPMPLTSPNLDRHINQQRELDSLNRHRIESERELIRLHAERARMTRESARQQPKGQPGLYGTATAAKGPGAGFSVAGYAQNMLHVGAWAAAAVPPMMAIHGAINLVSSSFKAMVDIGAQTARLDQVFTDTSSSAQQLTADVLGLAAANGRTADEALESSIAWARLGLNRVEVNEAVRTSLMAANVAEISAGEATKHLSAIMKVFNLNVFELDSALSSLNHVTNVFNVQNKDLLDGMSRASAIAKQTGMSFHELAGLIAAGVGNTGQAGARFGKMMESVLVQITRPEVQNFLRDGMGIEVLSGSGDDLKTSSEILADMWIAWTGMNREQRSLLASRIGNKTQASRFAAVLDNYSEAQFLALDSQLNLNSAELENLKIKSSMKSEIQGLTTAWQKLIVVMANEKGPGGKDLSFSENLTDTIVNFRAIMEELVKLKENWPRMEPLIDETEHPVLGSRYWNMTPGRGSARVWMGLDNELASRVRERDLRQPGALGRNLAEEGEVLTGGHNAEVQRVVNLRTMIRALPNSSGDDLKKTARNTANIAGFDTEERERFLEDPQSEQSMAMLQAALEEAQQRGRDLKEQAEAHFEESQSSYLDAIDASTTRIDDLDAFGDRDRAKKEREHLQELRAELEAVKAAYERLKDGPTELEESSARSTARANALLATHGRIVADVTNLYKKLPAGSAVARNALDLRALKDVEAATAAAHSVMVGRTDQTSQQHAVQLGSELDRIRSQITAAESPQTQAMARAVDKMNAEERFAGNEARAALGGASEAERLMNQSRALEKLIEQRMRLSQLDSGAINRAEQARLAMHNLSALEQNRIQRAQLQADLEAKKLSLMSDQRRELERATLMAGPSELLQRVAVAQLARDGLGFGEFMALDPSARRIAQQMIPALNPALQDVEREQAALGPRGSLDEEMAAMRRFGQMFNQISDRIGDELIVPHEVSAALNGFANQALTATEALSRFENRLDQFFANGSGTGGGISHPLDTSSGGAVGHIDQQDRSF